MTIAFIGLGSNLLDPISQIKRGMNELALISKASLLSKSNLYQNPPVGLLDQPDFINAVVKLDTDLSAHELLHHLWTIEQEHQRVRTNKNGPRTLDLDLLLFGNEIISDDVLTVPHPRMKERAFVLLPLLEIEPNLILADGFSLAALVAALETSIFQIVDC